MSLFWKKTDAKAETGTLTNELTVKLRGGGTVTTWHSNWNKDDDPRATWKDFYDWYLNDDTPSYTFGDGADPYATDVVDWVVTRDSIEYFYFRVYDEKPT